MIIGIEGPAGAGKTTMARTVASEMGVPVLEGGSWYRALTYMAQQKTIRPDDVVALRREATTLTLKPEIDTRSGQTRFILGEDDVTGELYSEAVSTAIAPIAGHIKVREVLEPKIAATARLYDPVIFVGRHLKRAMPEAHILRLTIDDAEAERRHARRAGEAAQPVAGRNTADRAIALKLGNVDNADTEVDVTHMTPAEQADILREFIRTVT